MGDLSFNLSRWEMACRCRCGFDTVDVDLVKNIQEICNHFADKYEGRAALIVTGPNRCDAHNAETPGAAPGSLHTQAKAMDFKLKVDGKHIPPREVYDHINEAYPNQYGLGLYSNRVHFDVRSGAAERWPRDLDEL
ncbi:MAG: hypothetical protein JKY34_15885 [Kordiimonadaceae bacterium]|nr:hypothetical protein [Kordiimonadaceae bacterium]